MHRYSDGRKQKTIKR